MADSTIKQELDQDMAALEDDLQRAETAAEASAGEPVERAEGAAEGTAADGAATAEDAAATGAAVAPREADGTPADAPSAADASDDEPVEAESEDSLTYSNGVIEKIVAMATREAPHVLDLKGNFMHALQEQFGAENLTKGVTVEVTDDNRVVVNISVIIEYGAYAPDIFEAVKERVSARLESMTGLEVAGLNLRIEDVLTPEEYAEGQRHLVDAIKGDDAE